MSNTSLNGQHLWVELSEMPMRVANNAVVEGFVGDTAYVYSFGGIDSTKNLTGITQKSMRYNTITEEWSFIPDLPDTLGKIASGASNVDNIIYIMGGYHVFPSSPFELSSDKVHRYDPNSNTYLEDGSPIPIPIDDQVQAVWRDSLIFLITGWSDSGNVPYVQIYNPYTDTWMEGNSTPNNANYTSFGASGYIIGDTIFYNGGAAGFTFSSSNRLRRGIINPDDPTQITWDLAQSNPGAKGYRMAATGVGNKVYWIGGSGVTYNYSGIAYNGSGGVDPLYRILSYDSEHVIWYESLDQPYGVMDLRGIAKLSNNEFIICGGMIENQTVSNKTFLIQLDQTVGIPEVENSSFQVYPNPSSMGESVRIRLSESKEITGVRMINGMGQIMEPTISRLSGDQYELNTAEIPSGIYILQIIEQAKVLGSVKLNVIR